MEPLDRVLAEHAPDATGPVLLLDAPGFADVARERYDEVRVWCDDVREAEPGQPLTAPFAGTSMVLAHLPKGLDALAAQGAAAAAAGADYLGVELDKHLNRSMNDVLARTHDEVRATRGVGKARGLLARGAKPGATPIPPRRSHQQEWDLTLVAHGRTFAGARLDAGTRLLLSTEGTWPAGDAVDIGCGNGVLTAVLARRGNTATGIDVSADAVLSTRATLDANGLEADVWWAEGLASRATGSADLIVTNPPFHVGTAKDSTPTLTFLADAHRVLRPGGRMVVVFNAHLPYLQALGARFGWADIVARDRDYVVASVIR